MGECDDLSVSISLILGVLIYFINSRYSDPIKRLEQSKVESNDSKLYLLEGNVFFYSSC